jgi:hypothetical protein
MRIRCNRADGYSTYWAGFCGYWNVHIRNDDKQKKTKETRIGGNNSLSVIMLGLVGGGPALQGRETQPVSSKVG